MHRSLSGSECSCSPRVQQTSARSYAPVWSFSLHSPQRAQPPAAGSYGVSRTAVNPTESRPSLCSCRAGSGLTEQSIQDERAAREVVERSAKIVGKMLDQINTELSFAQAVTKLTSDQDETEAQIIAKVVSVRLRELDQGFLDALEGFSKTARKGNNGDLADRLDTIRAEVLSQVTDRMPPEVRVLNTVTQLLSRRDRRGVLRQAAMGGHGRLPPVKLAALWLTATQVISDMEEKEYVPDRRLQAMVCVVREEIRFIAEELGQAEEGGQLEEAMAAHSNMLAPPSLAFLQRLMQVPESLQRKGLLGHALREESKGTASDIKPGQLLTAIAAMYGAIAHTDTLRADPDRLERLGDIQQEALQTLTDMVEKGT